MSPVFLRRFRAERMLRREFQSLRRRVLEAVRGRLRAAGIELDRGDLEAAYALAWQGLYAATLEGREIESPSSWLILVTYRRAIEEHRVQRRAGTRPGRAAAPGAPGEAPVLDEDDLAEELDLRIRLGQLLEGLSGRLGERERQAATLCYLQGLSRAEAASEMGISEGRMRKLMEGRGPGQPGVAGVRARAR
jgi:RNA polymerase sigma factor (sigma-70 family)